MHPDWPGRTMDSAMLIPLRVPPKHQHHHPGEKAAVATPPCRLCRNLFWFSVVSVILLFFLYLPAYQRASRDHDLLSATLIGWSQNTSRDVRLYVLPDNMTALTSPDLCGSVAELFLLVVVCSGVANFEARVAIRDTWASVAATNVSVAVRVAFLLGEPENGTLQDLVEGESLLYGDVIQEGFVDSYNNLTLKTVMLLKWVTTRCPTARYVMKTDDDMFVNMGNLVKLLQTRSSRTLLLGSLICGARPIGDTSSKWFVPKYMFHGKMYPNYLSGTGYVMSRDVARRLYMTALQTPLFHLEDVYLTGLCARAAGVRPRNSPAFTLLHRNPDPCLYSHPSVVTSHHMTVEELRKVWGLMVAANLDCGHFALPTTAEKPGKQRPGGARRPINKCV